MEFAEIFSPVELKRTIEELRLKRTDFWDRFYGRPKPKVRMPVGIDGVPFSAFFGDSTKAKGERATKLIQRLSENVLSGTFRFQPFTEVLKEKIAYRPGSVAPPPEQREYRVISICASRDSIVQFQLLRMLKCSLESSFSDSCFGYRTGRSSTQAVSKIRNLIRDGWSFAYESDIRKFFDRVPHATLITRIKSLLSFWDPRAIAILVQYIKSELIASHHFDGHGKLKPGVHWREVTTRRIVGLPQGGALSGFLTNVYLTVFDNAFDQANNIRMFRYADDFVILGKQPAVIEEASQRAEKELQALGLEIHPEKSFHRNLSTESLDFLGYNISLAEPGRVITRIKKASLTRRYYVLMGMFVQARKSDLCPHELQWQLSSKALGLECDVLFDPKHPIDWKSLGFEQAPTRSWLRYFRLINSNGQLIQLDAWVKKTFRAYRRGLSASHKTNCDACRRITRGFLGPLSYCDVFFYIKEDLRRRRIAQTKSQHLPG